MSDRHIVVVDAGTTRIRCLVFDSKGEVVVQRSCAWSYVERDELSPYTRELDADGVWRSTARLIAECVGDGKVDAHRIAAVTVTSQRQGVVFLDGDGGVLYAGPNMDLRAVFEGAAIDEAMGGRVFEVTGRLPSFLFTAAKLRWFKQHRRDFYDRIERVVTLADWLRCKLSGELVSERTLATEAGLLDIRRGVWCTELFEELGVRATENVPIERASTAVGGVRGEVADVIGVPEGVPVVVSGADTQCGLLGLGVSRAGQVGSVAGWSIPLLMLTDRPVFDQERRIWTGCHVGQGLWSLESTCGDAGNSYRWVADTMWVGESRPFESMDAAARDVPAGSEGVMSYFGASRMDMSKIGMRAGGFIFPIPMTYSGLGRDHATRAALESIAYAVRANLEQLESVRGAPASRIVVGGGMIATTEWVEMLPNVLGRPIEVAAVPNVTAAGAYFTATAALDGHSSLLELVEASAATKTMEPSPIDSAEYDDYYQRWVAMGEHLEMAGV
ncbi:MAG: FGGY-family carbohydrate kinase [Chloroflexi bacterium]|nr:FGGY-family carbohydrate kinase [Chloroflexota bacterium]